MFKYFKITITIFLLLAASRFIPHPPNFTSLLALSFYVPAILGRQYILSLILAFVLTDFIIGFHNITFFTWGSIILIGLMSKYFKRNIASRISGSLIGAFVFYLITNFGFWLIGNYSYTIQGLLSCYTLAIPFFTYSLISTFLFSSIIESIFKLKYLRRYSFNK